MDLQEIGFVVWTRFICLRTRTKQVSGYLEYCMRMAINEKKKQRNFVNSGRDVILVYFLALASQHRGRSSKISVRLIIVLAQTRARLLESMS
jgi:hypothetical protein